LKVITPLAFGEGLGVRLLEKRLGGEAVGEGVRLLSLFPVKIPKKTLRKTRTI